MASRGRWNNYIKSYVPEFERQFRVYLDCHDGSRSFISANLVDSFDPSLIEQVDDDREYVVLNLNYKTIDGQHDVLTACFEVVESNSFEFVLGDDYLHHYYYGNEGIILEGGEVKIYSRG